MRLSMVGPALVPAGSTRYRPLHLDDVGGLVPEEVLSEMRVVATVLPFRTNHYVLGRLIDWTRAPDDAMYQLTFPQRGMLPERDYERVAAALASGDEDRLRRLVRDVRRGLNPHPDGQRNNVPRTEGSEVAGVQHKYRETVLVFPSGGQTCHAYCSFCFRWPQFVGQADWRFATDQSHRFADYIRGQPDVTDVLITGGDPLVLSAARLALYLEPFLGHSCEHVTSIRIGTKALAYWPFRFLSDHDADDLLRLFERIVLSGRHLALMAHYTHPVELSTDEAQLALARVRSVGAEVRTQAPIVRHVNDDPLVWARLWREQVRLGCVPYYMFVPRETGANRYYQVPLDRALRVFEEAYAAVSGLGRTARGPVMSTEMGKVLVDGRTEVGGVPCFVLKVLQARDPALVGKIALAQLDPTATWLTDLVPLVDPHDLLGGEAGWHSVFPSSFERSLDFGPLPQVPDHLPVA